MLHDGKGIDRESILLNESQVALILGLTRRAMQERRRKNMPPKFVRIGRLVRYKQEEVQKLINDTRGN